MSQTRTTFQGKVRSSGGSAKGNATAGVTVLSVMFSFDPTATTATNVKVGSSASSGEDLTLPKGAVPISITTKAVATGGTNPTVDIGTSADNDGLFNELDADANNTTTVLSLIHI